LGRGLDSEGPGAEPIDQEKPIPSSRVPAARPPPTELDIAPVALPERPRPNRWRPGAGVLGGFMTGVGPGFAPTLGAFFEATYDGSGLWSPSFQLGALRANSDVHASTGSAELTWTALRLLLVPLRVGHGPWFLEPGATFDLGRLHGRGYNTDISLQSTGIWYGPGIMLRTGILAWDSIVLAVQVAAHFPLAQDRFRVSEALAHEVPRIALSGLLMLGVRP
jgi:hypothetical protein